MTGTAQLFACNYLGYHTQQYFWGTYNYRTLMRKQGQKSRLPKVEWGFSSRSICIPAHKSNLYANTSHIFIFCFNVNHLENLLSEILIQQGCMEPQKILHLHQVTRWCCCWPMGHTQVPHSLYFPQTVMELVPQVTDVLSLGTSPGQGKKKGERIPDSVSAKTPIPASLNTPLLFPGLHSLTSRFDSCCPCFLIRIRSFWSAYNVISSNT